MAMWLLITSVYGVPLLIHLAFALPALYFLRRRHLDDTALAVWCLMIVAVPVLGAVAVATTQPGMRRP